MFGWQTIKKGFKIAYRPSSEGLQYDVASGGSTTKTIAESLSAVLVLYASYSELSEKILKALSFDQSFYAAGIVRLLTCLIGIAICLHILFARKAGAATTLEYSQIPRLLAGVIIWLVLISVGITLYDLVNQPPFLPEVHSGSYEVPTTQCLAKADSEATETGGVRSYECHLTIPATYKDQYRDLRVFIAPIGNFKLKKVIPIPKVQTAVPQAEGPLEVGEFDAVRSNWEFPQFDPNKDWTMLVTLVKPNLKERFPDQAPLKVTIYFYK